MSRCARIGHGVWHGPEGCYLCKDERARAGIRQSEPPPPKLKRAAIDQVNADLLSGRMRFDVPPVAEEVRRMQWYTDHAVEALAYSMKVISASDAAIGPPVADPPPPVFAVLARHVVPGMLLVHGGNAMPITAVRRGPDYPIEVITGNGDFAGELDTTVKVTLPGPSPRELCCTCMAAKNVDRPYNPSAPHGRAAKAMVPVTDHAQGCPVAPVEGVHGGMRLWPAPWRGKPVGWDGKVWTLGKHHGMSPALLHRFARGDETLQRDNALQSFYHPPQVPEPERHYPRWQARSRWHGRPTPWDPEVLG